MRTLRNITVVAVYLIMIPVGSRAVIYAQPNRVDYVISLIIGILVTQFCILDAKILGKNLARSFYWLIFFTWPLAVPLYLMWSRGWKGLLWAFVHAFGLIVVIGISSAVTESIAPEPMIKNPTFENE